MSGHVDDLGSETVGNRPTGLPPMSDVRRRR